MKSAILLVAMMIVACGCASTGQELANDPDGCVLKAARPSHASAGPYSIERIRGGDPEFRTKANCASNRALEQMIVTRQDQQRNNATSFSPEMPAQ